MSRSVWLVWAAVVVLCLFVAGLNLTKAPGAAPGAMPSIAGKALRVSVKDRTPVFLVEPNVTRIDEKPFVIGRNLACPSAKLWVPLSEVTLIEEFADEKELLKYHYVRIESTKAEK